ncbi:MAG: hypothetical protein BWY62_01471 [Firmicutes bacterium ADurb.Bin356]|nr:MAG: hypothetical protein BWY62_01471 [Firmicutes bacterium ADurb.Bin356]
MHCLDFLNNSSVLAFLAHINYVVVVKANHFSVCRDFYNVKVVNCRKLRFFGFCGTRHSGELFIHSKEVLEGYCSKRFILALNLNPFFRLKRLMKTFAVAPAEHKAACKFINNYYLTILHNIVYIAAKNRMRLKRLQNMMVKLCVFCICKAFYVKKRLCFSYPLLG